MDSKRQTAQIFNHDLRALRRARAIRRYESGKSDAFIARRVGELAAERLQDINRRFNQIALIGLPAFIDGFLESVSEDKRPSKINRFEDWPSEFEKEYDLIISGLVLQSRNDVPQLIIAARKALKPDGFFLSVILGGESLLGLRRACFALDQITHGGVLPRVAPMIDLQQAGGLLSMAGLAQPVIDRDYLKVNYKTLRTLIEDLRDMGETNCLSAANTTSYVGRGFLNQMEAHYLDTTSDGKFATLFDLIWMSGWAPHASQQKPLKPGSAKTRLSDALKTIRES